MARSKIKVDDIFIQEKRRFLSFKDRFVVRRSVSR
jgi:hypothetical protein